MDSQQLIADPSSLKEQRRTTFLQKKNNTQNAARRPFKRAKVWKNSQQWKQSYKMLSKLDTVSEVSYEPHFGLETLDASSYIIDVLIKSTGVNCSDDIIKEVEGLTALFVAITKSIDMVGVMANIFLYVRDKFPKSTSRLLIEYICGLIGYSTQSGLEEPEDEPGWLKFVRSIKSDWAACVGNGLFNIFSKILSVLVIAGLADASKLSFSMAGFKMIEPDLRLINGRATDIVSAICDIIVFFCERCYHSWKQGSFRPLFSSSPETAQLEVRYTMLCNYWDMYRNGNLDKMTDMSEHDFLRELEEMATQLKSMMASVKGIDKRLLEDKFRNITKIIGSFNLIKVNSGFKRSPFSIEYYGLSKVGKSTISEQISHYLLTSASLSTEDGRKYTHVSGKKHWDGARSDMLELKLDDHANTKEKYVESSPCDVIIKVCNNVPYSPPMADLNEKGKVWIQPELVSLTTNVEDLDARVYSNNPYSIQRRMHYIVEVRVKKEFIARNGGTALGMNTEKVIAAHTIAGVYAPPMYHDVWEVDIKIAVPAVKETIAGTYVVVKHQGKDLKSISMKEACNFLCNEFHKHRDEQFKLEVSQQSNKKQEKCPHEGCRQLKGFCMEHQNCQFGYESFGNMFATMANSEYANQTSNLLNSARNMYQRFDWVPLVPRCIMQTKCFQRAYEVLNYRDLVAHYKSYSMWNLILLIVSGLMGPILFSNGYCILVHCFVCAMISLIIQYLLISFTRDRYYEKLQERHTLNEIQSHWQDVVVKSLFASALALGAIYQIAKVMKKWKSLSVQGSLQPTTFNDVKQRDAETNVWTPMVKRDLPISDVSKRMSAEQLTDVVKKALVYGSIHTTGGDAMVNGLMISSNVMLVPYHYFEQFGEVLECTFRKKNPEASGGKFAVRLCLASSHRVPDTDLCLCYTPTGGSFKNITDLFPITEMPNVPFRMFWRKKDGEFIMAKGLTKPEMVTTNKTFMGGLYENLNMNTFGGLCGATLISDTRGSSIIGVHLGGKSGTPQGCYGSILQKHIYSGIEYLRQLDGIILSGEAGTFRKEVLGVQVMTKAELHKKSPLNFIPEDSQIEYYGSCIGRSVTKTSVKVTPISPHILDVCNVPNIYRGPKLNPEWYGWQECLANLAVPAHPYSHDLLVLAIKDYKEPLIEIFKNALWNDARPLTDHENICGIPGKKFMDGLKLSTSVGFPLTGPKRDYIDELPPTEEWPNNRELQKVMMDEINYNESCYRSGKRAYPIAKACKKDEILTKDKCRIFYGNALSLTFLVRKYFLPILRVLQMNPLVAECAVGINSHGSEWEDFHKHATRFGMDRLFGGDYGKYDQKLPSQLIFAALRMLIDFARVCNYSEEDLKVMEAMTGDIVFAMIAFNGDLVGLTEGTHISGNSLTVFINSLCGSLNLRCFFYSQYPPTNYESRLVFRECVAAMTYGDDNIGSVAPHIDRFTIKECSKFLGEYGQVYTMPDKESELIDFLPEEEFEFLKRQSVYHPKLGRHLGALLDKSIYKSLHCFIRDKNSPDTEEMSCAQNIDGALREWFNHGEDRYEEQRQKMVEVAKRSDIAHMCTGLHLSYDDRITDWHQKYDPHVE